LTALINGLTFDRFVTRFFDMALVTLPGYRSIPATRACPNGCDLVPSS